MRECLGCETYAKYTHTHARVHARLVVCAFYVHVRPSTEFLSVFVSPSARTPRLPRLLLPACARFFIMGSPTAGPTTRAVVPGGIRDDTLPMSPSRSGMVRRFATHRRALARFIAMHARRLTANRRLSDCYMDCALEAEKMMRSFHPSVAFAQRGGERKATAELNVYSRFF